MATRPAAGSTMTILPTRAQSLPARTLELQRGEPLILTLARGHYCPEGELQASRVMVTVVSLTADSSMANATCWSCAPSASA